MTRVFTDHLGTDPILHKEEEEKESQSQFNLDELALYKMALSNIESKIQEKLTNLRMERSMNQYPPPVNNNVARSGYINRANYDVARNTFTISQPVNVETMSQPVNVETIYNSESDYDEDIDFEMEDIKTYNY